MRLVRGSTQIFSASTVKYQSSVLKLSVSDKVITLETCIFLLALLLPNDWKEQIVIMTHPDLESKIIENGNIKWTELEVQIQKPKMKMVKAAAFCPIEAENCIRHDESWYKTYEELLMKSRIMRKNSTRYTYFIYQRPKLTYSQ
ncbi:hypothetical protein HDV06_006669 [Boothiomyces sp. JEL0866]|nr:hypothetical protein HDV06_006669 [Boothiomyces sp. JEL0866]